VFHSLSGGNFHPKLYVVDKTDRRVAYIGSSNLTLGGLRGNVEANVRIEASLSSREADEPLEMFTRLFDSEFSTPLTAEFEARYNELQEQQRAAQAHQLDVSGARSITCGRGTSPWTAPSARGAATTITRRYA